MPSLLGKPTLEVVLDASDGLNNPFGVAFGGSDIKGNNFNAFVAEFMGGRVHKLTAGGELITISGNGEKGFAGDGKDATKAVYNGMHNIVRTTNGDLYISDAFNNLIRKIDGKTNLVSTIAGIPGK